MGSALLSQWVEGPEAITVVDPAGSDVPDGVTLVRGEERVDVPVEKVVPVDATGAGDQFAAGFLYGLATGRDLETCGRMGNICAGEVIRHIGPRPQTDIMALFKAEELV